MRTPHPFIVRLEERRAELGLSLDTVAGMTGLSRAALSQWKNGRSIPRLDSLDLYAKAMGVRASLDQDSKVTSSTRHLTASAVVFDFNVGAVLLVHHNATGKWVFPGGHVDPNETPGEAALREVLEETGIHATIVAPPAVLPGMTWHPSPWLTAEIVAPAKPERPGKLAEPQHWHIDHLFLAGGNSKAATTLAPDEVAGVRWVTFDEIDSLDVRAEVPPVARSAWQHLMNWKRSERAGQVELARLDLAGETPNWSVGDLPALLATAKAARDYVTFPERPESTDPNDAHSWDLEAERRYHVLRMAVLGQQDSTATALKGSDESQPCSFPGCGKPTAYLPHADNDQGNGVGYGWRHVNPADEAENHVGYPMSRESQDSTATAPYVERPERLCTGHSGAAIGGPKSQCPECLICVGCLKEVLFVSKDGLCAGCTGEPHEGSTTTGSNRGGRVCSAIHDETGSVCELGSHTEGDHYGPDAKGRRRGWRA